MAVDSSDFTSSLFENLKLEDPWLPPTSWDSIPSESGPRISNSSSTPDRTRHASPSVSEASMVRLAMNALQGVQSALVSIEKLSTAFCSDPADRTFHQIPSLWNRSSSTHSEGKILKSIGYSGFLVFLLRKFVDYFTNPNFNDNFLGMGQHENPDRANIQDPNSGKVQQEEHPPYSLVNHAFSVAVGKIIEGYVHALDTLYASVRLRDSSESSEMPFEAPSALGCLTTVVYSKITLLELYLHTKELRTRIEALGNICNLCPIAFCFSESSFEDLIAKTMLEFCSFFRGGDLLTYLHAQLQVADPSHHAVIKFLFLRSFEPYCEFIRSWIYKAEISDPYKEFIVEYIDNLPSQRCGKAGMYPNFPLPSFKVRDGVTIPCFLKDHLVPLIRAGQQLQVLMKLLELCTYVASNDHSYEDLLPTWKAFSSNHSPNDCPITFTKENIETRVVARGNYYKRMLEKLENLLTKLEFRYQQVVSHETLPKGFSDGRNSHAPVSFKLDNCLMLLSAEDTRELNVASDMDSDGSSTMDDSSYMDNTCKSSDSSSSYDEEKIVSEQVRDLSSHMAGVEQKYLSSLSFFVSSPFKNYVEKPYECEESYIESDSDGICERDVLYDYEQSHHHGKFLDQMSVAVESQEPNWSYMSFNQYLGYLPENDWLVNGLLKNSIVEGSSGGNSRSNPLECNADVCKMEAFKESIYECRKMIVINDALPEVLFSKDQQDYNIHCSNFFTLKNWKVNSADNFLSINPMLTKFTFLNLQTDAGERDGTRTGKPLPYFDFSSVEDPCKGCLESFSAGLMESGASATGAKSDLRDEKHCDQDVLIVKPKIIDGNSLSERSDHNQKDATSLISGGSSWEKLLARSSNTVVNGVGDNAESSLAKFDIPLDFIIDKCLLQEIMLQYPYLYAQSRKIQGFLELAIQRSSCECDHNKDRLYVYMKGQDTMPLSASAIGLGYRVDWPVSIVLTSDALKIYSEIFSFLIKVKIAIFSLTDIWCSLKELRPLISLNQHAELREEEVDHFNLLMKMRHQVNHFVSTLQQYVESQLSHVSWCRFLHSLQHKVKDMMDLESVHMAYLIDSLHICFLSDEMRPVARIIDSILQCALDFRSCLKGGMWDVGMNLGELVGKLSRINISQVLAIKKTFDKNLKEMHLYYVKSPKHGEYGLSRFWGYLNFNEYYSDVRNEMQYYAFSI
ncbi:Gamma-tubulin complex component protein [Parasponia andersonii]|uniref:Gamma-tubulin complex component protein n=1 Tax=Parasponia andersonii TaxID=3476 RepID=A0A2P5CDR6_PARAD|nr:Gamma-tubulin complex component protein [Parasponia andersonii]